VSVAPSLVYGLYLPACSYNTILHIAPAVIVVECELRKDGCQLGCISRPVEIDDKTTIGHRDP